MRGILLISHGQYAEAFKGSLKMIAGDVSNLYSACLLPSDGPEEFTAKLTALEPELAQYDEVLVFADLFGGSPCNNAFIKYASDSKYSIIAGMNFPMVLTAILSEENAASLVTTGREGLVDVREFMAAMGSDED